MENTEYVVGIDYKQYQMQWSYQSVITFPAWEMKAYHHGP